MFLEIWKREEEFLKLEHRERKGEDCLTFNN